jgi:hypothetical protein
MSGYMDQGYLPFLYVVSHKMISLLCAWFWNGALGSLQHLWHWCCHIEVRHGYTPHQSHSWCMWLLTENSCIKVCLDLQADKSPVVVKGPFFPRVVNPRYRIRGINVWCKTCSSKADKVQSSKDKNPNASNHKNQHKNESNLLKTEGRKDRGGR